MLGFLIQRVLQAFVVMVVISALVFVGVFAIGTIAGTNAMLQRSLAVSYAASRPAAATFFTATGFDPELVDVVQQARGLLMFAHMRAGRAP